MADFGMWVPWLSFTYVFGGERLIQWVLSSYRYQRYPDWRCWGSQQCNLQGSENLQTVAVKTQGANFKHRYTKTHTVHQAQ